MDYSILIYCRDNGLPMSSENRTANDHCVRESSMPQYFYNLCRNVMTISHVGVRGFNRNSKPGGQCFEHAEVPFRYHQLISQQEFVLS